MTRDQAKLAIETILETWGACSLAMLVADACEERKDWNNSAKLVAEAMNVCLNDNNWID